MNESIENVLEKYGGYGKTGRVVFKHRAYVLVAKILGGDWNDLNDSQKIFLKGEMIDAYAGTWRLDEEKWKDIFFNLKKN